MMYQESRLGRQNCPVTYLATYGCFKACSAVILLSGLNCSNFLTRSIASELASGIKSSKFFLGLLTEG